MPQPAGIKIPTPRQSAPRVIRLLSLRPVMRANQWAYRSMGLSNSVATSPLMIFLRISPSMVGCITNKNWPSHTQDTACSRVRAL